jgi:glycopeptide antibiotics resistance protein
MPMRNPCRNRSASIVLIIAAAILGLGSRRFAANLPDVIVAYAGDTAWALAVFLMLGLVFPNLSTLRTASLALVVSVFVEVSQLYHAPWIDSIRDNPFVHLALGSGFDPRDLACYTVGIVIGALIETLVMSRHSSETATS